MTKEEPSDPTREILEGLGPLRRSPILNGPPAKTPRAEQALLPDNIGMPLSSNIGVSSVLSKGERGRELTIQDLL